MPDAAVLATALNAIQSLEARYPEEVPDAAVLATVLNAIQSLYPR